MLDCQLTYVPMWVLSQAQIIIPHFDKTIKLNYNSLEKINEVVIIVSAWLETHNLSQLINCIENQNLDSKLSGLLRPLSKGH